MRRVLGFAPNGREIRRFKQQLSSLAGATLRLAILRGEQTLQVDTRVITAFDLWASRDCRQRTLWPQTVRLSEEYFGSLQRHAVPLDERAVGALAHSALGLDLYAGAAAAPGGTAAAGLHPLGAAQRAVRLALRPPGPL